MAMLGLAVANLKTWEAVAARVRGLGANHIAYGARPEHYATVGAALLSTLEKGLGASFKPEVRDAWIACYRVVSEEMKAGASAFAPG